MFHPLPISACKSLPNSAFFLARHPTLATNVSAVQTHSLLKTCSVPVLFPILSRDFIQKASIFGHGHGRVHNHVFLTTNHLLTTEFN